MRHSLYSIMLIIVISGCATANKINNVGLGMTKQDVVKAMGSPSSTSAKDGREYLIYQLSTTDSQAAMGFTEPYFVRLVNGRVDSYGKLGDFDSIKPPESKLEVKVTK